MTNSGDIPVMSTNADTHDPLCLLSEPCSKDEPSHGFCSRQSTWCIHCERECICERLAKVRADERKQTVNRLKAAQASVLGGLGYVGPMSDFYDDVFYIVRGEASDDASL